MKQKISKKESFNLGYNAIFGNIANKNPIVSFKSVKGLDCENKPSLDGNN